MKPPIPLPRRAAPIRNIPKRRLGRRVVIRRRANRSRPFLFGSAWLNFSPTTPAPPTFLELARNQSGYGGEASSAFNRGVTAYQNADLESAQTAFEQAVAARSDYADAWAWLGRIHFDKGEYSDAASDYRQALTIVPDNASYRFFAEEAARLAGDEVNN